MTIEHETTVAIIEDNYSFRRALEQLLSGTRGFRCLTSLPTVERALADPCHEPPEVILLGSEIDGRVDSTGVGRLLEVYPQAQILMLTSREDEKSILRALIEGARGYLLKPTPPVKLLDSIQELRRGGAPLSPGVATKVVDLLRRSGPSLRLNETPTAQELRLLSLLSLGHSYQTAGLELGISVNTVRNYIRSVYQKFEVHTKSEAVTKALRAGLI